MKPLQDKPYGLPCFFQQRQTPHNADSGGYGSGKSVTMEKRQRHDKDNEKERKKVLQCSDILSADTNRARGFFYESTSIRP
jgi:hypothetical protein